MSAGKEEQPINDFRFDFDLFQKLAKEYGVVIRECEPGQGGIFVKGKRVTGKDIFAMKDCYCSENCDRCIWKRNGGCYEWNGTKEASEYHG